MTEAAMEQLMTKHCFGNGNDEETICYVDLFLYGLNHFQGLFVSSALQSSAAVDRTVGTSTTGAGLELSIPPTLHRQGKMLGAANFARTIVLLSGASGVVS